MTRPSASPAPTQGGALSQLLETEARLEAMLARARAEATQLVTAAREEARAREAELPAELEAASAALERTITEEQRRREAQLSATAREQVEALERVGAAQIEPLAQYVVGRVIGAAP